LDGPGIAASIFRAIEHADQPRRGTMLGQERTNVGDVDGIEVEDLEVEDLEVDSVEVVGGPAADEPEDVWVAARAERQV
jgi:hypothetical protein